MSNRCCIIFVNSRQSGFRVFLCLYIQIEVRLIIIFGVRPENRLFRSIKGKLRKHVCYQRPEDQFFFDRLVPGERACQRDGCGQHEGCGSYAF